MWNLGDWIAQVVDASCGWPSYPLMDGHVRSVLREFAKLTEGQQRLALELVQESEPFGGDER